MPVRSHRSATWLTILLVCAAIGVITVALLASPAATGVLAAPVSRASAIPPAAAAARTPLRPRLRPRSRRPIPFPTAGSASSMRPQLTRTFTFTV